MKPCTDVRLTSNKGFPQLIAGIKAEGGSALFPGIFNSFPGKQQKKKGPQCYRGNNALGHPLSEHHRVGSAATAHMAPIIAEYPGGTDRILARPLVISLPFSVLIQAARYAAMGTRHKIQLLCKLVVFLKTANILCVLGAYVDLPSSAR